MGTESTGALHLSISDLTAFVAVSEVFCCSSVGPRSVLYSAKVVASPTISVMLPPVLPSKIVCVGLNYKDHAAEQNKPLPAEPLLFLKPPTAVIGPGASIEVPMWAGRIDHEAELGIVIGKPASRVPMNRASDHILGLICFNDVTARDMQNKEPQYTRCKSFDTFGPIGPCITTGFDGRPLAIELWVNSERRQGSSTRELIFPVEQLIEYITFVMTLEPGDIISTGTPGAVVINNGDVVECRIEGFAPLLNHVRDLKVETKGELAAETGV